MDIIQEAKEELGSGSVAYAEFILDYSNDKQDLYCFYEGKEDKSYYSIRIELTHSEQVLNHYVCNGKESVLKAHDLITSKEVYSNSNVGFFVDRDFQPIPETTKAYYTPFYSIENFYTTDSSFEKILINEFHISKKCECFDEVKNLFDSRMSDYCDKLLVFNSWLSCQSDYRIQNNITTYLSIDDTLKTILPNDDFNKIVSPDLQTLNIPSELLTHEKIEELFHEAPKIPTDTLDKKINEYEQENKNEVFRGKLQLRFLISFLTRLQSEIGKKKNSIFSKKYSCNLRFEYTTGLSQLTNNAFTPSCLITYIQSIKRA